MERGEGEWDESVTSYQFDPHIISVGDSIAYDDAFTNGTLASVYQPPPPIDTPASFQVQESALPRPNLPLSLPTGPREAVSASMEVHPNTPPLAVLEEHDIEVDITSSESSGQPLSNDDLFDTTPDLSDPEIGSQSDIEEANSPIIHRRLNVSLASSTSSAMSDNILSELEDNMDDQAHRR